MSATPSHNARSSGVSMQETNVRFSGISVEEIRTALDELLQSSAFAMSKRCGDFLAFVVEQTLLGHQHELKERTIGVGVFGRDPAYDTSEDAIVRIKASEVRKRLGFYYAGLGKNSAVWISLPTGGYVPDFVRAKSPQTGGESNRPLTTELILPSIQLDVVPTPGPHHYSYKWRIGSGLLLAAFLLAVAGLFWLKHTKPASIVDQFWNPVFQNPAPVLIVTTPVPAYISYASSQIQIPRRPTEYVLTTDQFVGQGDVRAAEQISTVLQGLGHASKMMTSSTVDFHELSRHSLVLIGYSSTQWAAISKEFRYFIDDSRGGMITDRGQSTEWYPHHLAKDLHTDEDYAIVSRVYVPEARAMVVLVSGATQYGTESAAELVTNSDLLSAALRRAPQDWPKKNLQLVLHLKVIGDTPEAPEVIATEFW
jgi:hypothetical protein